MTTENNGPTKQERIDQITARGGHVMCSVGIFVGGTIGPVPACVNCTHHDFGANSPKMRRCFAILDLINGEPISCETARRAEDACGVTARLFDPVFETK
jgi:hypothetical protein